MDEGWISKHVRHCVQEHKIEDGAIIRAMTDLSQKEVGANTFVATMGKLIRDSTDAGVCQARRCVQEHIIVTIVDAEGKEPLVPNYYEQLASTAIAKHLWTIFRDM